MDALSGTAATQGSTGLRTLPSLGHAARSHVWTLFRHSIGIRLGWIRIGGSTRGRRVVFLLIPVPIVD